MQLCRVGFDRITVLCFVDRGFWTGVYFPLEMRGPLAMPYPCQRPAPGDPRDFAPTITIFDIPYASARRDTEDTGLERYSVTIAVVCFVTARRSFGFAHHFYRPYRQQRKQLPPSPVPAKNRNCPADCSASSLFAVQATAHDGEAERVLLEDVNMSVVDMAEVVGSYKNRRALSKLFGSALCKRRKDEADAAIAAAVQRLEVGRDG